MSQNPTQKKGLKLSTPFEPTSNPTYAQPYYPQTYQYEKNYYPQPYVPPTQVQQVMHEQGNTINSLSLNGNHNTIQSQSTSTNTSNGQQPQSTVQNKPKKKLVLNSATQQKFVLDQNVEKKADEEQKKLEELKKLEEEKLKKEQEQQRLLEQRKPKPYSKEDLKKLVDAINDFNEYFDKQEWQLLKERKHFNIKELQTKSQPRKEGKINTYTKTPKQNQQINSSKPAATAVQPFDRAQIQPATETQPKIIIVRVVEDIQTKQLKDRMKTQAEDFFQNLNQTPEQKEMIFKELRYKLNQLAPDNFDMISSNILKIILENKNENLDIYLEYLAQKIIEKSQTEPKYRKLYTKLCSLLIAQPQLIVYKEKKDTTKSVSLFKSQLLNQVQQVFDERKNKKEDLSHMKPEEREQYHLIRKQKIMGNVRFIGDLFVSKLLPMLAVESAIRELISDYVAQYLPNQENSEESIEGLIELFDQIGEVFRSQNSSDYDILKKDLQQFFDGTTKNLDDAKNFLQQKLDKKLSVDLIMEIFNLLVSKYKVSQRISMLIENVQERKNQGWKDHYSKQDQAQSVKTIHQEQEKEIIEQNYNQSKNKNKKYQSQQVLYVEKNSSQQSSSSTSSQQKQQFFDLNELAIFVQGTFKMEPQQQEAKLLEELKRVGPSDEAIQKFFEIFFEQLLSYKLIKQNIERAQMVFELLSKAEAKEEIVKKATQKALNEDRVYDLADSTTAIDLLVDIIGYFLNESDINSLKKLYFKPEIEIEEFNDFMSKIATQLIIKYSDKDNIIKEYYSILGYQI